MAKKYPLEALLRPPVEFIVVAVALLCSGLLLTLPRFFAISYESALILVGILFLCALRNCIKGFHLLRYQYNLNMDRGYTISSKRLPVHKSATFIGHGFRWTPRHTQRLYDLSQSDKSKYARSKFKFTKGESAGGANIIHGVELKERKIWISHLARHGHTLIVGTTGVGKTRLAELLITQDIRRGDTTFVICPKGDLDLLLRVYAEAKRAGRPFYCLHLGYPEISCRYNGIGSFTRITQVASRIANQLPGEGDSAAFREFSWRFINIVTQALVRMGERPDYQAISKYIINIESLFQKYALHYINDHKNDLPPFTFLRDQSSSTRGSNTNRKSQRGTPRVPLTNALMEYVKRIDLNDVVLGGLKNAIEYEKTYYDRLVASVLPLLEKLTTGTLARLLAPNYEDATDESPILDWLTAIRQKAVVFIGLDGLTDMQVAAAVGNAMFADIVSVAGHIYKHGVAENADQTEGLQYPTVRVHADEFSSLVGEEFVPLLNQSRGAGIDVVAYTQTLGDIEAGVGSRAKAQQIIGNYNTIGMLRVADEDTAKLLIDKLPRTQINMPSHLSSATDSSDPSGSEWFKASTEDRILNTEANLLETHHLVSLPKGQAFFMTNGGNLYKIRFPLLSSKADRYYSQSIKTMFTQMGSANQIYPETT